MGDLGDAVVGSRRFQQYRELVTTEPGYGVLATHQLLQSCGHGLEQGVADWMAEAVVDILESVEVQKQQRQTLLLALSPLDCVVEAVEKQFAVRQPGEVVEVGQAVNTLFTAPLLCDVTHYRYVFGRPSGIVTDRHQGLPRREDLAVLAPVPDLAFPYSLFQQCVPQLLVKHRRVLTRAIGWPGQADQFLFAVADHGAKRTVDAQDASAGIGNQDAFGDVLEYVLRQQQRLLGALARTDVAEHHDSSRIVVVG